MTKAQQVRSNRVNKLTGDVSKIFDWILDLIDENTEKGVFHPIEVVLYNHKTEIEVDDKNYNISPLILNYDRKKIMKNLYNLFNNEEGFEAKLDYNSRRFEHDCITLEIDIE